MIKLYLRLHNANKNFKKQFLSIGLLTFLILHPGTNANAQCDVNPVANQAVCNNSTTTAINFTGTATTFNWVNNTASIGLAASGMGNIASFTALNPGTTAVTATITVTPSTGACTGAPISFTITVNPSPNVLVTPNTTCGGPCNSMTASGADTYVWSPLAGLFVDCPTTLAYVGTNLPTVYTMPTPTNYITYTVTGRNSTTGCFRSVTGMPNYTPAAPVITPPAVFMCLGDPPVKLKVVTPNTAQFCSGPISIPVPDNNPAGAFNSIVVAGLPAGAILTEITATINMPHTRIGNMVFVLKAPNGNVLNLDYHLGATGGTGPTSGFSNTFISSLGTAALSSGVSPYTGTFKADAQGLPAGGFGANGPTGMLQTVSNWLGLAPTLSAANGNWTLGFYDGVSGDVGTLTSWCLNISYTIGAAPAGPAVWSPAAGLFSNLAATIPYIPGTAVDSVWTRPTPAGVYPYQVITQGVPAPLCTPTTNFVSTNGNSTVTFNLRNNHPFPIKLSQIDSKTFTAGPASVRVFYKPGAIAGSPGAISPANGWNQIGIAGINGNGISIQPFISGLSLVIPAGITYGICVEAQTFNNLPNLAYSVLNPGIYSFNDDGCELITGTNIGYSGLNTPAVPTVTPSGFIGAVHFMQTNATCPSPPTTVVVTVGQAASITSQPANQNICLGNSASFTVGVSGAGPFTYQWQASPFAGGPWTNIINGGVFGGVNSNTLLITTPPVTMNGYSFRLAINGGSGCAGATSTAALLTINPLPNIAITANPLIIGPTQTTTIISTVTPNPAATYTWYYNNSILPGEVSANLLVNYGYPGDYQLKVTDVNGCSNLSNTLTIANSFALNMYTYPNPNGGKFQVRYYSEVNRTVQRSLTVYDNRGNKILTRNFTQTIPYQKIDVDIRANGKGIYWIELRDADGKRLAMNRAVVQ